MNGILFKVGWSAYMYTRISWVFIILTAKWGEDIGITPKNFSALNFRDENSVTTDTYTYMYMRALKNTCNYAYRFFDLPFNVDLLNKTEKNCMLIVLNGFYGF